MTKALVIPTSVKRIVFDRDNGKCVICGRNGEPCAHFIPRSQGGLGIEQNIVTLCRDCHRDYDNSYKRTFYREIIREHLEEFYPNFSDEDRVYKKWR
jgi:5-methylcytosine-specific restriction endonuclease McrA